MYRLVIFLACLAVGYGNVNSSTSAIIKPTLTVSTSNKTTSMPIVTTYAMSSHVVLTSSMVMSTSMPTPTPASTPAPKSTVATTTPKPVTTSAPKPPHGDFSIMKGGKYCLLAQLDVVFNVTYYQTKKEGNKTNEDVASIPLPKVANTSGSECGKVNATLVVSWPESNPLYKFTMKFVNNASTGWMVDAVTFDALTKDNKTFTHAKVQNLTFTTKNESNLQYLSAHINGSYMCGIGKDYPFSNNSGVMIINYARLQPFGVENNKKGQEQFGEENNCQQKKKKKEETSNIVPIAVGCALAGLVLIVLIAYIIGRRKSQRGYEKV